MSVKDAGVAFERTSLWKNAFHSKSNNRASDVSGFYAAHLRDLREKAGVLIRRIRTDIPFLTVHDLTHADALWEIASLIVGTSYPLTPAEGYVFGAAVLLHDAAMCLAAFPRGLTDIRLTNEWKDTIVMLYKESKLAFPKMKEIRNPLLEIKEKAVPIALRLLHARQAEQLPSTKWVNAAGDSEYLIENSNLRDFYGQSIGKIARSHGESMSWLQSELGVLGPLAMHDGGEVNMLKLACILRAADAAQLDARRAPSFERTIIKPKGVSDLHWTFQSKLAKPRLERDALVYTAGSAFSLAEAEAWWLCFDSLQVVHRELLNVDAALENASQPRFKARKVHGVDSPQQLAKDVRTEGWEAVDACLKVSNVPGLVRMFGGTQLYGNHPTVAIRELIQNSADAVRARRKLEPSFVNHGNGEIVIRLTTCDDGYWLEVEDNGIGMSSRTLTGALLDFGRSFWSTSDVQIEFPGLISKGMSPTGKFGIGFFSVFMLGDLVRVTSRRYDASASETRTLEFRAGLSLRPILRNASPDEMIYSGGTRVAVLLRSSPYEKDGLLTEENYGRLEKKTLNEVVGQLCPSLDVGVSIDLEGRKAQLIRADDWLTMDGRKLLKRLGSHHDLASNLRLVGSRNVIFGRACVVPYLGAYGMVTVGGLSAMRLRFLDGILVGKTDALARDKATLDAPPSVLARWAEEQADLVARSDMSPRSQVIAAGVVIACGANPRKLPIAFKGKECEELSSEGYREYMNRQQLELMVKNSSKIAVYHGEPSYEEDDPCHPDDFESCFVPSAKVIFLGRFRDNYINDENLWFPHKPSYWSVLRSIIERHWKRYSIREGERIIGRVDEVLPSEIRREVKVITRE